MNKYQSCGGIESMENKMFCFQCEQTMLGMLGANIMDDEIYHDEGEHLSPTM